MMEMEALRKDFLSGKPSICLDFRFWKTRYVQELSALYDRYEAESLFYWAAEEVSGMPKPRLLAEMGQELDSSQSVRMEKALSRLQKGEPVQYVFGKAYFAGLELEVGPGVLIPRPETEELFLWVLDTLQAMAREGNTWRKEMSCRILDLCTGSGALALALASRLPHAEIWGCDLSSVALDTARRNALNQQLPVHWFCHDILKGVLPDDVVARGPFQIMVSNPPYVTPSERAQMRSNVLDYEPAMALFVEGQDPLLYYKALAKLARSYLQAGGYILLEINEAFPRENQELLRCAGFDDVEVREDFKGKARMVRARQPLSL